MAEFISIKKDVYKIVGTLTDEDIIKINNFKNRTTLILENTVGLSSELVSKIKPERIVFRIIGGLDYEKKEKYNEQKYADRTFVSPSGLKKIIKYFEYNESLMDPNWNEFEKAMFMYNALVVDMDYAADYEKIQTPGTTERSLNGILYGKLVCAGFALVYKEMLDRIGIKSYYQNQKDVHAFNIIEIDGKKYGVDVTWDNTGKKNNNGKCSFGKFANDSEFYSRHGHQLYTEVDLSDDFEESILQRVYDRDEEEYELSLLGLEQLKDYYSHISSKINSREPFRYDLQNQPLEVKNKYLPVDIVEFKLKQEAAKEYPFVIILGFLKKRNAIKIDPQLLDAFFSRRAYVYDIGAIDAKSRSRLELSQIGINNYEIDIDGNIKYYDEHESRRDILWGVNLEQSNMSQEEMDMLCNKLNEYIAQYFNTYVSDLLKNVDTLLENYEYEPDEWDSNRAIESVNIFSKLSILAKSHDYLMQLGISEEEVNNIIQRITDKHKEIHKPYERKNSQREQDLDFLYAVFNDLNMVWQTIEYDLQREITEEEFISLFTNADYMIELFQRYITVAQDKKFNFDEYDITKEDLQQLLNKVIQDYISQKMINETTEFQESQNGGMRR